MNVAIIGYGIDGKSAAVYWLNQGHNVTICDAKDSLSNIPEGAKTKLGKNQLVGL